MKGLTKDMQRVVNLLEERGGYVKAMDIAQELGYSDRRIMEKQAQAVIRQIRKKFMNDECDRWIFSSPEGYTLVKNGTTCMDETTIRCKMSFHTFLNGAYVIQRAKRLSNRAFQALVGYAQPKLIEMGKILK